MKSLNDGSAFPFTESELFAGRFREDEVIDFDLAVLFQPWFEQVKPSVKER